MNNLDHLDEPASCGHIPANCEINGTWWLARTFKSLMAGTLCFNCALLADRFGYKVSPIPTNAQMLQHL